MKWVFILAFFLALLSTAAFAGDNTAVGIGTGISSSRSQATSNAVAIGGGNATGGTGIGVGGGATAIINQPINPAVTSATINNTGTSTVRNVPSVFSPGLAAAGIETCLGSVSGGGSWIGTGFSFGSTIPDPGCNARLSARTLWSMGLRRAAVARLCLDADIYRSMPEVCVQYIPSGEAYRAQPVPVYRSAYASADAGIMLVEGKTGREHLCSDYNEAAQICRKWADGTPVEKQAKKRIAARSVGRPTPARVKSDPPPAETPKTASTENSPEGKPATGF